MRKRCTDHQRTGRRKNGELYCSCVETCKISSWKVMGFSEHAPFPKSIGHPQLQLHACLLSKEMWSESEFCFVYLLAWKWSLLFAVLHKPLSSNRVLVIASGNRFWWMLPSMCSLTATAEICCSDPFIDTIREMPQACPISYTTRPMALLILYHCVKLLDTRATKDSSNRRIKLPHHSNCDNDSTSLSSYAVERRYPNEVLKQLDGAFSQSNYDSLLL